MQHELAFLEVDPRGVVVLRVAYAPRQARGSIAALGDAQADTHADVFDLRCLERRKPIAGTAHHGLGQHGLFPDPCDLPVPGLRFL